MDYPPPEVLVHEGNGLWALKRLSYLKPGEVYTEVDTHGNPVSMPRVVASEPKQNFSKYGKCWYVESNSYEKDDIQLPTTVTPIFLRDDPTEQLGG